jgi:hypothetical protein
MIKPKPRVEILRVTLDSGLSMNERVSKAVAKAIDRCMTRLCCRYILAGSDRLFGSPSSNIAGSILLIQKLRISRRRALKRSIQRAPISCKDDSGVFESYKRPRVISSAISIAKVGNTGKPILFKRVSYRTRVFFSVYEIICLDS